MEEFKRALFELCPAEPAAAPAPGGELPEFLVYRPQPARRVGYRIYRTDRGFRVVGEAPDEEELDAALKAAGARKGDMVEVGGQELELG